MTIKTTQPSQKSKRPQRDRRITGVMKASARQPKTAASSRNPKPAAARSSDSRVTKQAQILQLLNQPQGASIEDLMEATSWQQHSVRGFLAGTIKKKLGLALTSSKPEGEPRRYRIVTRRGR